MLLTEAELIVESDSDAPLVLAKFNSSLLSIRSSTWPKLERELKDPAVL